MYIKYDLVVGIRDSLFIILGVMVYALIFCINLYGTYLNGDYIDSLSTMDYIIFFHEGAEIFYDKSDVYIPITWLLFQFLLCFATVRYPLSELKSNYGNAVLFKGGSREKWIKSKLIWIAIIITVLYFVSYVVIFVFSSLFIGKINMNAIYYEIDFKSSGFFELSKIVYSLFIIPILSSTVLCTVAFCLSLLFNRYVGFTVVISLLVSSVYVGNPLLAGNGSMLLRSDILSPDGINCLSYTISLVIEVVLIDIASVFVFKGCDLI